MTSTNSIFNGLLFSSLILILSNVFVMNTAGMSNNFELSEEFQNKMKNFGAPQQQQGISDDFISVGNALGNGCSVEDMIYFQNYITQLMDLITIDENAGELSLELYTLGYIILKQNFSFSLFYEDGTPIFVFEGRDMYLFGEIYAFVPDLFWNWVLPGYATCEHVSPSVTQAVYRYRGGDFLRSVGGNVIVLVEFEWHWEKNILGDEDGFVWWRAVNYTGHAITDFGRFASTLDEEQE